MCPSLRLEHKLFEGKDNVLHSSVPLQPPPGLLQILMDFWQARKVKSIYAYTTGQAPHSGRVPGKETHAGGRGQKATLQGSELGPSCCCVMNPDEPKSASLSSAEFLTLRPISLLCLPQQIFTYI